MLWREIFREVFGLTIRLVGLVWVFSGVRYLVGIFNPDHEWNPTVHLAAAFILLVAGLFGIFKAEWIVNRSYRRIRPESTDQFSGNRPES